MKMGIGSEDLYDMLFFVLLGVVLGGRLGYVLFYNLPYYLSNPLQIFAVWEGGMSFHGGLIGVALCGWLFCRLKKIKLIDLADLLAVGVPIGLGLGRLGNFINAELYGRITDVPWCMEFPNVAGCRHPSQLYEFFLEGVVLFIIMQQLSRKEVKRGTLFFTFLILYGIFRSFVEFFREPDLQIGFLPFGFTMGQVLSIPLILIGVMGIMTLRKKAENHIPLADKTKA